MKDVQMNPYFFRQIDILTVRWRFCLAKKYIAKVQEKYSCFFLWSHFWLKPGCQKCLVCELIKSIVGEQWYFSSLLGQENGELFNKACSLRRVLFTPQKAFIHVKFHFLSSVIYYQCHFLEQMIL